VVAFRRAARRALTSMKSSANQPLNTVDNNVPQRQPTTWLCAIVESAWMCTCPPRTKGVVRLRAPTAAPTIPEG